MGLIPHRLTVEELSWGRSSPSQFQATSALPLKPSFKFMLLEYQLF